MIQPDLPSRCALSPSAPSAAAGLPYCCICRNAEGSSLPFHSSPASWSLHPSPKAWTTSLSPLATLEDGMSSTNTCSDKVPVGHHASLCLAQRVRGLPEKPMGTLPSAAAVSISSYLLALRPLKGYIVLDKIGMLSINPR